MSATNSTTNYGLPIFLAQDVPSWLTDWNSAMSDIDTAIAAAKTAADGAQLTASNAQAAATQNAGAITQLQTTVGSLGGNVTSLSGAVNTINSLIGNGTPTTTDHTLIGAINELHADQGDLADLQTTDKSSLVAAINEAAQSGGSTPAAVDVTYSNTTSGLAANNVQAAIDELAAGGSAVKVATEEITVTSGSGALPATYDNKKVLAMWSGSYLAVAKGSSSPVWAFTMRDPGSFAKQTFTGTDTVTVFYAD